MGQSFADTAAANREGIEAIISAAGQQARRPAPIVLPDGYEVGAITPRGQIYEIRINTASGPFIATYDPNSHSITKVAAVSNEEETTDGA